MHAIDWTEDMVKFMTKAVLAGLCIAGIIAALFTGVGAAIIAAGGAALGGLIGAF
jgi:uncharacterized membrane-anchored protein YitT (DUF2179 family)